MSIENTPNGKLKVRWYASDGKHRSKTFEKSERKLAVEFEAEMRRAKRSGAGMLRRLEAELAGGSKPLGAVVEEWWGSKADLRPKTLKHYRWLANTLILPFLGDRQVGAINARDIEDWLANLNSGATAKRHAVSLLNQVFAAAMRWNYVSANPVEIASKPKRSRKKAVRPPTPETVEAIRSRLHQGDATLVSVLAYAGLRPQEAIALRWDDIRERTLLVDAPKTEQSRAVRILAPLAQDLREWRMAAEPNDLIFPTVRGNLMTEVGWHNWRARIWYGTEKKPGAAYGLGIRPYDCRHTFVSLLIREGKSVVEVARQAGHSPQVCLATYAHVFEDIDPDHRVSAEDLIWQARGVEQQRRESA